jgi:hypothetical protein
VLTLFLLPVYSLAVSLVIDFVLALLINTLVNNWNCLVLAPKFLLFNSCSRASKNPFLVPNSFFSFNFYKEYLKAFLILPSLSALSIAILLFMLSIRKLTVACTESEKSLK